MPKHRKIVLGQTIDEDKIAFARQLRRSMTKQERMLWISLRSRRMAGFKFRRQQVFNGYIADFYCDEIGLVIEIDGCIHATQIEYDKHRDAVMESDNLLVIRIPNSLIDEDIESVLKLIEAKCVEIKNLTP